jgi:ribosomal protein S10
MQKPTVYKKRVTYTFYSLFSPSSVKNLSLYLNNSMTSNISNNIESTYRSQKILIKQSYLLLVWLSISSGKYTDKTKPRGFAFLPKKKTKFTMTKAPMAHKTFSQEQFVIQYRRIIVRLPISSEDSQSIASTLMSIGILRSNKLTVGTNLMFTSKVSFSLATGDKTFFNINKRKPV